MKTFALVPFVIAIAVAACTSGDSAPSPDSGSGSGSGAAFGSACTVASDTSTECASGVCTDSINQGGDVCSQKCDMTGTGSDCPSGSMGMKCNMKGYCRP